MLALNAKQAAILSRIAESPFVSEEEAVELLKGSDDFVINAARAIVRARIAKTPVAPPTTLDETDVAASDIAEAFIESARSNRRPVRRS
jgi:hypothetical protein